jgi:hypothetical protein
VADPPIVIVHSVHPNYRRAVERSAPLLAWPISFSALPAPSSRDVLFVHFAEDDSIVGMTRLTLDETRDFQILKPKLTAARKPYF